MNDNEVFEGDNLPRDEQGNIIQHYSDEVRESQKSLWIPMVLVLFGAAILFCLGVM